MEDVFKIKCDDYKQEGIVTKFKVRALAPLAGSISWMTFSQALINLDNMAEC